MPVVSTMILNALIANGAKSIGGTLTSGEQSYYLSKMNSMIESWSLDRTLCYAVTQENFSLTENVGTYTIGSGATFNTARPTDILSAFVRDSTSSDSGVEVVGYDSYDSIINKTVTGSYPQWLFYDKNYSATSTATIKLYPLPKDGLTLYINSAKQLQSFASVTTTVLMPPGYQRAIESNFTIETAPGLKSVQPEVVKIAKESLALVKGVNLPEPVGSMDSGIVRRGPGNILTGP